MMLGRLARSAATRPAATTIPPVELADHSLEELMGEARRIRDSRRGRLVTYSPKVFIPLTKLCRDVCHYCTFAGLRVAASART